MRIFDRNAYSIRQQQVKLRDVSVVCREGESIQMRLYVMLSRLRADKNRLWAEDGPDFGEIGHKIACVSRSDVLWF